MRKSIVIGFFLVLSLLLTTYYLLPTASATHTPCHITSSLPIRTQQGLITTSETSNTKYTSDTGTCIFDPRSSFAPFKIPTYADLKSQYFTQSKAPKSTITALPSTLTDGTVYKIDSNLTIPPVPTGGGTAVVFVEGNLNIEGNYTYGTGTTGTVFVVGGNVNIKVDATQIDAIIISGGTICTASDFTGFPSSQPTCPGGYTSSLPTSSALIVNGGLISLDSTKTIRFRRSLSDNSLPAEVINNRSKYLVTLRNILSSNLQKWSEVTKP